MCFKSDLCLLTLLSLALGLTSCSSPQQRMDLNPSDLATPPHNMSRGDYPFDSEGHYVDSWARAGAARYGGGQNSDRADRPSEPPRRTAARSTPPPPKRTPQRPTSSARPKQTSRPSSSSRPSPRSHTVSRGDTLSSLSRRYGVSVDTLRKANNIKGSNIQKGRRLTIPR